MTKLTKSQKIIFGILAVVVLFAVYDRVFLASRPDDKPPAAEGGREAMKALVQTAPAMILKAQLPERYGYLIRRAEAPWAENPFLDRKRYNELAFGRKAVGLPKLAELVYSGFIGAGKQQMAIINNVEYMVNERLEAPGFVLREIFPDKVVIEDTSRRHRFNVPIRE